MVQPHRNVEAPQRWSTVEALVDDRHIGQDSARLSARLAAGLRRWRRRLRQPHAAGGPHRIATMFAGGLWRRSRDLAPVDALLFSRGRYLHRVRTGALPTYRLLPFQLPSGVRQVGDMRFVVDLDKVTTYCGFSFAPGGWHPFVAVLRELDADPSLRYEDSLLRRLYARFTPASVQTALFDEVDEPLAPLDRMPAVHEVLKSLWQLDRRQVERLAAAGLPRRDGDDPSRYLGPKSDAGGAAYLRRLAELRDSVRRHGYDVTRFGGGRPRGFFLVRDGEYRFVMTRGNHRLPVLSYLGVRQVVATIRVGHPPVVDAAQLERWSLGGGGAYPLDVAQRMFDRLFTATGAERASALGLIGPDAPAHESQ